MKNQIIGIVSIVIILIGLWVGLDAFFGLVGEIYRFLDGFIWAFFAGIIAFFIAIGLVSLMLVITFYTIAITLTIVITIVASIISKWQKWNG